MGSVVIAKLHGTLKVSFTLSMNRPGTP